MKTPATPGNEAERLESLCSLNVLDTPAEERFDRITRLAKAMFQVPIALVSLVDEKRQWFKSRQGLLATETTREISFCGHAILSDEILWVPNALEDERFHDNPLVAGDLSIRFYAGYPLKDRDGNRLGTLCVIDHKPRPYSSLEAELLSDLGRVAEHELDSMLLGSVQLDLQERSAEERRNLLDASTGVWNRDGMLQVLASGVERCKTIGRAAMILVCEVHGSSRVGGTWTEPGLEFICSEVAQVLRRSVRRYDSIGRYGSQQFVLMLAGVPADEAEERIRFLQRETDRNSTLESVGVSLTFGYACFDPEAPATVDELLDTAAQSLGAGRPDATSNAA